jgi:hypothetical protein
VPIRSKSLAFVIENPSNQNSSQLADNKQNWPALIENFEPNHPRVFVPRHAQEIDPSVVLRPPIVAFLTGSGSQTEIDVTHSNQTPGAFLTGSRIAHCASWTLSRDAHLRVFTPATCAGGRFAGVVLWNTDRGWRSTCLNCLSLHLTNCRLSRLQLFRSAGVCINRCLRELTVRAGSFGPIHQSIGSSHPSTGASYSEVSFVGA